MTDDVTAPDWADEKAMALYPPIHSDRAPSATAQRAVIAAALRAERAPPMPAWALGAGGDTSLPEDAEIDAAFPTRSGRHDLYAEAMRLVGARCSKGGLVALVNWLLVERDAVPADSDRCSFAFDAGDGQERCTRARHDDGRHTVGTRTTGFANVEVEQGS